MSSVENTHQMLRSLNALETLYAGQHILVTSHRSLMASVYGHGARSEIARTVIYVDAVLGSRLCVHLHAVESTPYVIPLNHAHEIIHGRIDFGEVIIVHAEPGMDTPPTLIRGLYYNRFDSIIVLGSSNILNVHGETLDDVTYIAGVCGTFADLADYIIIPYDYE